VLYLARQSTTLNSVVHARARVHGKARPAGSPGHSWSTRGPIYRTSKSTSADKSTKDRAGRPLRQLITEAA
jgi:hypothetical protein